MKVESACIHLGYRTVCKNSFVGPRVWRSGLPSLPSLEYICSAIESSGRTAAAAQQRFEEPACGLQARTGNGACVHTPHRMSHMYKSHVACLEETETDCALRLCEDARSGAEFRWTQDLTGTKNILHRALMVRSITTGEPCRCCVTLQEKT